MSVDIDAWLEQSDTRPIYLVECEIWDVVEEELVTLRFSDMGYITSEDDTPANTYYDARIMQGVVITKSMWSGSRLAVRSTADFGDVILANADAGLDSFLDPAAYAWVGRTITGKVGEKTWSIDDFYTVFSATITNVQFIGLDKVRIAIAGKKYQLKQEVVNGTGFEGGNVGASDVKGDDAVKGKPKMVCLGEVFNIQPELVNEAGLLYRADEDAIQQVVAVYDRAWQLTPSTDYTDQASAGGFKLLGAPDGVVTADIKGRKPGGTYIDETEDIIEHLLTGSNLGGFPTSTIGSTFGTLGLSAPVGIYISARDMIDQSRENMKRTLNDVIDQLANGVGCFIAEDQSGKFQIGRLTLPSGSPVLSLDETMVAKINLREVTTPAWRVRVAYQRNHTIQETDIDVAGGVTIERRNVIKEPYLLAIAEDETILDAWPFAEEMLVEAWFAEETDAQDEADRLLAMYGTPRQIVEVDCLAKPYAVEIGDVVSLTYPRFNLSGGKDFRVIQKVIDTWRHTSRLVLWG
jgi:hypothetical protein